MTAPPPTPTSPSELRFAGLLASAFALVLGFGLLHHDMWLDEYQAWLIARDASSLSDLAANLYFEGHPGVWHLLLYGVTRFTTNPRAMQVLQWVIATSAVFLLGRHAPWPRWQRVLAAFGYFVLFEYGMISRSYTVGELLLFSFCALWPRRRERAVALAVILVLLAHTSVFGLIVAVALSIGLLADRALGWNEAKLPWFSSLPRAALLVGLVLFGWAMAIGQMLEPPGSSFAPGWHLHFDQARWDITSALPWRAFVPIANFTQHNLWDTNWPIDTHGEHGVAILVGLVVMAGALLLLVRRPAALLILGSGTGAIFFLDYAKHAGQTRHTGHIFLLFLAAWWIAHDATSGPTNDWPRAELRRRVFFGALLAVQVAGAALLYVDDLVRPFSYTAAAADLIRKNGWQDRLLVADIQWCNYLGPALSAIFEKPLPFIRRSGIAPHSFIVWNRDRVMTPLWPRIISSALSQYMPTAPGDVVLVLDRQLQLPANEDRITEVGAFRDTMVLDERNGGYLYYVKKEALPPTRAAPDAGSEAQ